MINKQIILRFIGIYLVCFIVNTFSLQAQNVETQFKKFDSAYGLDSRVYKGVKYMNEHRQNFGIPFLFQDEWFVGNVNTTNIKLDSVNLKYDVYKQVLVMSYTDYHGFNQQLIINTSEINTFNLNDYRFVPNNLIENEIPFLHELVNDSVKCYAVYRKNYELINNNTKSGYGYTNLIRKIYLKKDSSLIVIKSKGALLKELPKAMHTDVKSYIKSNKINIRKSSANELISFFNYINGLYKTK